MKYLEVIVSAKNFEIVQKIAEIIEAKDLRYDPEDENGMQLFRMIISDDTLQKALDDFSKIINTHPSAKVVVMPIEAYLPKPEEEEQEKKKATAARETIYEQVEKNAHINIDFIVNGNCSVTWSKYRFEFCYGSWRYKVDDRFS